MRLTFTFLLSGFILLSTVSAQPYVVPVANATTAGGGTFLGPLANAQRTYQLLINENQLTGLVGRTINGFTYRLLNSASTAWPASSITYNNYDIYLSGSVPPSQRNITTFASNVVGVQTQVRSGSLTIAAGAFAAGGAPNAFGSVITFNTGYLYKGGHMLVEIRHTGFTGTSTSVDALTSSSAGFGTDFSACWTGSYTGTGGSNGNFAVLNFTTGEILPLLLSDFKVVREANEAKLRWTTSSEINTKHFELERSLNGQQFKSIATLNAQGNSATMHNYEYRDKLNEIISSTVYYRLKMFDKDGTYKHSKVVALNVAKAFVTMFPNPATTTTTLNIRALQKEQLSYCLANAEGRIIKTAIYPIVAGNNTFTLDVSDLSIGTYFIQLQGRYSNQQLRFVKQ